jgi:hypothetical protein
VADGNIQVTSGAGPKLATSPTYTDNASNVVQDQKVILGENIEGSYTLSASAVAIATGNSHLFQVMAGGSLNVRIRRIRITQFAAAASVAAGDVQLWRLNSAGTGGTVVTARPLDTTDTAGATGMTLPSAKGSELAQLWAQSQWHGTGAIPIRDTWEWTQHPGMKPILIPAGVANGIAIKQITGIATVTVDISIDFTETIY